MKRIDGAGHVGNRFVTEDAATSRPPTEITAAWLNGVQEEICNVIVGAGLTLNGGSETQLRDAIIAMVGSGTSGATNADTLDGYDSTQIWRNDAVVFNTADQGYYQFPPDASGRRIIHQWGPLAAAGGNQNIAFGIPFPNACFSIVPSIDSDTDDATLFKAYVRNRTRMGFQLYVGGINMRGGTYFAVGW